MSKSEFPLCESLGLGIYKSARWYSECGMMGTQFVAIRATEVEALLAKGVRAVKNSSGQWIESVEAMANFSHVGTIIDIKPIVRERRRELSESEVREALWAETWTNAPKHTTNEIIERLFGPSGKGGE